MSHRLEICHGCDRADWSIPRAACRADGERRYIGDLAELNACPLNKFKGSGAAAAVETAPEAIKESIPLPGDMVAAVTEKMGIKAAMEWWSKNVTGKRCGCADRQRWLNEVGERFYKWAGLR